MAGSRETPPGTRSAGLVEREGHRRRDVVQGVQGGWACGAGQRPTRRGSCTWERRTLPVPAPVFRVIPRFSDIHQDESTCSHVHRPPPARTWERINQSRRSEQNRGISTKSGARPIGPPFSHVRTTPVRRAGRLANRSRAGTGPISTRNTTDLGEAAIAASVAPTALSTARPGLTAAVGTWWPRPRSPSPRRRWRAGAPRPSAAAPRPRSAPRPCGRCPAPGRRSSE